MLFFRYLLNFSSFFLFSMILKEKREVKIKQVLKKMHPAFYFFLFLRSYNRNVHENKRI